MRFPARHVVILALACFAGGLMGMARAGEESEPRFSSTLSPAQQAETGLDRLTVDNIAVIDALVRLDASSATRLVRNNIRTTRFSARRTAHERDIAGLDRLTPEQLRKLDQFVALRIPAPVPADADLAYASVRLDSTTPIAIKKPAPEIHGSVSLTYGWNRGGSIRGVDTSVTYIDPHKRYAVTVGYSDYRGNGLASYPLYPYAAPYLSPYSALNRYPPSYRPPSPVLSVDDEN